MPPERVVRVDAPEPSLTVYPRRGKQALLVLGAVAFVVAGGWLLGEGGAVQAVAGVVAIVVFGLFAVLGARQLVSRRPALVVDRRGITDHASALGAGFVPWAEIRSLGVLTITGQQMVVVGVADPEAVLARVGPLQRAPMRANARLCGYAVALPTTALPLTAAQLLAEITALAPPPAPSENG